MDLRPVYKQTEVGVIPSEWDVQPFGHLAEIERGKFTARPRNDPRYFGGGIPFIQTGDVTNASGHISTYSQTLNAEGLKVSKLFPKGTLFFTIAANIGDVGFASFDAACPDSLVAITTAKGADKMWLSYELASRKTSFENIATHNAQLNINLEKLRPYLLPVPPLPEQRAIASALSDVDALLGGLDRLIAKKRDLKQAAMQQLLTGQTRLPGFGGEWEVRRLGEVGSWKGGMTPSMQNPAFWINGNVPWISSGDVKALQLRATASAVTLRAVEQGATALIPARAIVIVTRSGILRRYLPVAITASPMAVNQDIKALTPGSNVSGLFLLYALLANGDRILARCMKSGTTVESIEFRWLKDYAIRLPRELSEQIAIAAALSDMDAEIDALEARREKTRDLKQAMMQELLTGRTRLV